MANITLLPSAKVPLIYDGELTMTTEWYRFFWNIYGFTGTGVVPVNKGGTGIETIGNHQLIIGNANNVFEPALLSSESIAITYPAGFINLELGTSGVTAGTYGSASQVGVFTVNDYGVLTAASNTSIGIDANQIISGTLPVIRGGTGQSTYTDGQLLIGNSTGNTLTKATLTAGTGISVTNGAGSITIANTGVLSVSGTAPVVSSGGATPAISMAAANTTTDGYLTSTDWNTFNNKAPATSGTSILYGNGTGGFSNVTIGSGISFAGGTLSATGSGGTVTSVSGTAPISVATGTTTPVISISQATTSTDGYLSSTDWNTFNNKQPAGAYLTAVTADAPLSGAGTSASHLVISQANTTTNGYLSSTDWNTFNSKANAFTYTTNYIPYGQGTTTPAQSSLLQFDGTKLTVVGNAIINNGTGGNNGLMVGTSISNSGTGFNTVDVNGLSYSALYLKVGDVNKFSIFQTNASTAINTLTAIPLTFGTNDIERMRIFASGGVSIGNTTDPGATNLSVTGTVTANGVVLTGNTGTVTSVAALTLGTTGTDLSSTVANSTTTPVITLNVPTASATNRGALSAADWSTFNGKAPGVTFTSNYVPYGQGTTTLNQSANLTFDGTTLTVANRGISTSSVPVGSVIQVVNAVYTTQTGNSTNVLADSGLTATITPLYSTSKILVIVDQNGCYNAGVAQGMQISLLRGASILANLGIRAGGDSISGVTMSIGSVSGNYLDSPATTSATTYKTQFSSLGNVAAVYVQVYSSASTITLMEIAA